jgi:hypothetical protein
MGPKGLRRYSTAGLTGATGGYAGAGTTKKGPPQVPIDELDFRILLMMS